MAAGDNTDNGGGAIYFTEDIIIQILLYLPIASCIARFRCVCRSWRSLLSDSNLIRKILFYQSSDEQKSLRILITGTRDHKTGYDFLCSVYSYETLRPIDGELATIEGGYLKVVGCCDGIFCMTITERNRQGEFVHNIVLWNPTTSEIKIIPPGPSHPCHSSEIALFLRADRIGFGYDPRTKDYKVVRVLEFEESMTDDDDNYDYDPAEFYHGPLPLVFSEVYSLRNDSWKTLNVANHYLYEVFIYETIYLHQEWNTCRNEKCYWFREESPGICAIASFDMSTEEFELVTFPQPAGLPHHDENINDPYGNKNFIDHEDAWYIKSAFMLNKGVIVATFASRCVFCGEDIVPDNEIWALLKCGVGESWTKLLAFPQWHSIRHLEVWKNGAYICEHDHMSVFDIVTGEAIREHVEIEGTGNGLQARVFTPTRVSISQLIDSD
ncbi:F-box/kelch-repeat protein At3g23880 [Linum perenne]